MINLRKICFFIITGSGQVLSKITWITKGELNTNYSMNEIECYSWIENRQITKNKSYKI